MGHPDEEPAGNGGVEHTGRTPRLAGCDCRARRRRRRRRTAQGGIRNTVALARQPVDEPGADGRRSGRPRPGDALPRDHRSDWTGPDLPGCGDRKSTRLNSSHVEISYAVFCLKKKKKKKNKMHNKKKKKIKKKKKKKLQIK